MLGERQVETQSGFGEIHVAVIHACIGDVAQHTTVGPPADGLLRERHGKVGIALTVDGARQHPIRPVVFTILVDEIQPDARGPGIELIPELCRGDEGKNHTGRHESDQSGATGRRDPSETADLITDDHHEQGQRDSDGCQRRVHAVFVGDRLNGNDAGRGSERHEKQHAKRRPRSAVCRADGGYDDEARHDQECRPDVSE